MDPVNIKAIGSSLKACGYRGAQKYMSAIKQLRVSQGFAWSDLLELSARRFNMSTSRGIGPSRQSEPLPLNKVITIDLDELITDKDMPANGSAVACIASFWLLRELEMAAVKVQDVTFDHSIKEGRLLLSASKNDPEAKGVTRQWRCTCEGVKYKPYKECPYHALWYQYEYMLQNFQACETDPDHPFFVTLNGEALRPEKVLAFIEKIAEIAGGAIFTKAGDEEVRQAQFPVHGGRALGGYGLGGEQDPDLR